MKNFGLLEKYRLCFLLMLSLFGGYAHGQCPSSIPNLSSYGAGAYSFKKIGPGCLPFTLSVKNNMIGVSNVRTIFDYKGGPLSPELFSRDTLHTYTKPNVYTLIQLSVANGRELIACQRVYVYDTLQPNVSVVACGTNKAKIKFASKQDVRYDSYFVQWGDGTRDSVTYLPEYLDHTYLNPSNYSIQVWGVNKPGYCRSQVATLSYFPAQLSQKPSIERIAMQSSSKGELTIRNPLPTEVLIQKQSGNRWVDIGQVLSRPNETVNVIVDSLVSTCFRVQATDSCLVEAYVSEPVCTALLNLEQLSSGNKLEWNAENKRSDSRMILTKDGMDWRDISQSGQTGNVLDDELSCGQTYCYSLVLSTDTYRFTSHSQCRSTPIDYCEATPLLFVPDAFSPNGDGINDLFMIKGEINSLFELTIFNAWGSAIFHTKDPLTGWDGTFQNTQLPPGPYLYRVKLKKQKPEEEFVKTGTVYIVK